jgi:dihydropteroate synthase
MPIQTTTNATIKKTNLPIERKPLVADPGFGFGKSVQHNLALLKRLPELAALGVPILAGWSRKSSLGAITGRDVGERLRPAWLPRCWRCSAGREYCAYMT